MVQSQTTINPLGVWLTMTNTRVVRVEPMPFTVSKTGLAKDTTNTILSESAGADQVLVVHEYAIAANEDLNITVEANNETIHSSTRKKWIFDEGLLVRPQKSFEIKESHTNTSDLVATITVKMTKYWLDRRLTQ